MCRLPLVATVAAIIFASESHGQKWPRSGVRICAPMIEVSTCYSTPTPYCFWSEPSARGGTNHMGCYDCFTTMDKCLASALKDNTNSEYTCKYDATIRGTADVRLSNGKTEDTGYSSSQCDSECASKSSCKSFVFVPRTGYCELWSIVGPYTVEEGTVLCFKTNDVQVSKRYSHAYCNGGTGVTQQYGLTLEECALATLSDSQCSGEYFSYTKDICQTSSSCNHRQCKCAGMSGCGSRGTGDAWDVYRVTEKTISKTSDGGSCSSPSSCASGTCRGGNCCNSKGKSTGCTDCDSDGDCGTCSSNYIKTNYECFPKKSDGGSCSSSSDCSSGTCRGGNCCGSKGKSTGCTSCDSDGDCATCSSGYTKTNYECSPAKTSDGGSCSSSSSCASGTCRGGNCCNSKGRSDGCTDCDSSGDCSTCDTSRFYKASDECYQKAQDGYKCSASNQCSSADCRGGSCCSSKGRSAGCTECDTDGDCKTCGSGYVKSNYQCVATTTTATTTTATATTTTTPYGYMGAVNCPSSCTRSMYENDVCDPECNNYECRYDFGTCAHTMATNLQRARTLAVIGRSDDALSLFETMCSNVGVEADPPDVAPTDVDAAEHDARLREFEAQQSFTWISCSAAENLLLGKTFYGKAPNEVSGAMTWTHLKEKVKEKMEVLKTMDSEIANVQQLAATFAATERIESFTASSLSAVAVELKDYIGESVDGLSQKLDAQTREMREIAQKNEDKLDRAAELQRRILVQSIDNGEDLEVLDAKVDHIAEDTDLILESAKDLKSRANFMIRYAADSREIITSDLKELSETQRKTLEQVVENAESLDQLDDATKNVMNAVLSNSRQLQDLSVGQRTLLNTVLESRDILTEKLDEIDATTKELSTTQRLTLVEVRRNAASLSSLSENTQTILTSVLDNGRQLKDLSSGQRILLNKAMTAQYNSGSASKDLKSSEARARSAYSMAWDDNGDGVMSSQEQVSVAMDMAMSPSSAVGKVMSGFKSTTSMQASSARALVVRHLGSSAGSVFDKLKGRLSSISADDVMDVLKSARKVTSTITKTWDTMKALKGKSWTSIAASTFSMASKLFGRGDFHPATQGAAAVAKSFSSVLSTAAKGKSLAAAAYSAIKTVKGVGSCVKTVGGAVSGFAAGGFVGTGISLVKSAVTGSLGSCVKTVIDVGKKVYNVVKKVAPVIWSGAKKVVKTVYNAGKAVVKAGYNAAKYVYNGAKKVASAAWSGAKSVVKSAWSGAKSVAKSAWSGAKSAVSSVAKAFCFWCRRRRDDNSTFSGVDDIEVEFDFEEEDKDAILNVDELFTDAGELAAAASNFYDAADGLYFNVSKGIELDVGVLSRPDIEAKYSSESNLFAESLLAVQAYAQRRVELEAQARTDAYLTDNVGRCLLVGECDLKDRVDRYDMALDFMRMKREAVVFSILEEFVEMNNAFQYELLESKLKFELTEKPTLADLQTLLTRFSDTHTSALTSRGGVPQEASVYYTFSESDEPEAFAAMKETGVGLFTVPLAEQSIFRDVRVSGYEVQAYVYPSNDAAKTTATVQVSKGGYSTFYPMETMAAPMTYLHTDITDSRVYSFIYNPQTCTGISQPCSSQTCSNPDFLSVSPYGEWRVEIPEDTLNHMQLATEVRMAFKVAWHTSNDDQQANYSEAMFGDDKCDTSSVCFVEQAANLITQDECDLPGLEEPAASSTGLSPGGQAAIASVLVAVLIVAAVLIYKRSQSDSAGGDKLPRHARAKQQARTKQAHTNANYDNQVFDGKHHYERGALSRVDAEKELASGLPGAFVVRAKDQNQVLTTLIRAALPDGTGAAKFAHNMIAKRSHGLPLLFNNKKELGSPSHTNIHEAIVYLATPEGAAELGLEVPLVGVIDEEIYGQTVYGSNGPKRMESGSYGQTVYASPSAANSSERCPSCRSKLQWCTCSATPDERQRARTLTAGKASKQRVAGMHSRTLDTKTSAFNKRSIERFNSEEDDAHDYVNTSKGAAATMA